MWGRLREIFISRGTARYPVGGSSAALLLEVEGFLIRKGLQPGSERSNMECNFIFFLLKNIRHLQNLLMDRQHKQETSHKLRLGIRKASP